MSIAELMKEIRKLPDDDLLALAAHVDEEAARAVDHRFESLVRDGHFADLAVEALNELKSGKTKPNIHLVLPSNESIKVEATESQLEGADYLYRTITLNVHAMEHIRSGQLRDLRLIDVVRPLKEIDEDKLKSLWRKGRNAWAEITSPTEWVERLRES